VLLICQNSQTFKAFKTFQQLNLEASPQDHPPISFKIHEIQACLANQSPHVKVKISLRCLFNWMRSKIRQSTEPIPRVTAHDPGYLAPQRILSPRHMPESGPAPCTRPPPPQKHHVLSSHEPPSSIHCIISGYAETRVEVECSSRRRVKRLQCITLQRRSGSGFDVEGIGCGCGRCLGGGCKGGRRLVGMADCWITGSVRSPLLVNLRKICLYLRGCH
jgi:hypothetical protein